MSTNLQSVTALPVKELLEMVLAGTDPDSRGTGITLASGWEKSVQEMCEVAACIGDQVRLRQIRAIQTFLAVTQRTPSSSPRTDQLQAALDLCRTSGSEPLHSWVAGQMGILLGWPNGVKLLEEALQSAASARLQWAECQWAINLGAIYAEHDASLAEHWLLKGLKLSRDLNSAGRIGSALHNLAMLYAINGSLEKAKHYELEAIDRAHGAQLPAEAERCVYLGQLCERLGEVREAVSYYSRALDLFRELRHAKTFELIRHVARIITKPFEENARSSLTGHLKRSDRSLTQQDIGLLLARAQKGEVMMSGWSPEEGSVVVDRDIDFAKSLCDRGDWEALAVYSRYWMEHGFLAGDSTGLHWLSISFRKLGFEEAAESCLEFGLRLHDFFEHRPLKST